MTGSTNKGGTIVSKSGIRPIEVEKDDAGEIQRVRLGFGPHYFVELLSKENEGVDFVLGATHHGFIADATEINGELEKIINEVRDAHPNKRVD